MPSSASKLTTSSSTSASRTIVAAAGATSRCQVVADRYLAGRHGPLFLMHGRPINRRQVDYRAVQYLLGHRCLATTELYLHGADDLRQSPTHSAGRWWKLRPWRQQLLQHPGVRCQPIVRQERPTGRAPLAPPVTVLDLRPRAELDRLLPPGRQDVAGSAGPPGSAPPPVSSHLRTIFTVTPA